MEEKVIKVISEQLGKKKEDIKLESKLVEDLGADSIDLIEMVTSFEDMFGIEFSEEDYKDIKIVRDIVTKLEKIKK